MLSRLLTTGTRCGLGLRARQSVRCVSLSAHLLGGGGHHHVDVPEPHIPKPQQKYETNWLGRKIVPRLSHDKHEHSTDDYASYFGGVVFVLLTVAAVAFYTDVFDMNIKKDWQHKHHRTYSQPKKETDIEQEAADEAQLQQPADVPKVTAEQDEAAASALMTAVEEQVEGMKEAASHVVEEVKKEASHIVEEIKHDVHEMREGLEVAREAIRETVAEAIEAVDESIHHHSTGEKSKTDGDSQ